MCVCVRAYVYCEGGERGGEGGKSESQGAAGMCVCVCMRACVCIVCVCVCMCVYVCVCVLCVCLGGGENLTRGLHVCVECVFV